MTKIDNGMSDLMNVSGIDRSHELNLSNAFADFQSDIVSATNYAKRAVHDIFISSRAPLFIQRNEVFSRFFNDGIDKLSMLTPHTIDSESRFAPELNLDVRKFNLKNDFDDDVIINLTSYYVNLENLNGVPLRASKTSHVSFDTNDIDNIFGVQNDLAKKLLHGI